MKKVILLFLIILIPTVLMARRRTMSSINIAILTQAISSVERTISGGCSNISIDGLISYWKADNSLTDEMGVKNATVEHGAISYVTGANSNGKAWYFDGGTSLEIDGSGVRPGSILTIAFWMKLGTFAGNKVIFDIGALSGNGLLGYTSTTQFEFTTQNGGTASCNYSANSITATNFNHYAIVLDGSYIWLFVNKKLIDKTAYSGTIVYNGAYNGIGGYNNNTLEITAAIDNFAIYNRALSHNCTNEGDTATGEIAKNYSAECGS